MLNTGQPGGSSHAFSQQEANGGLLATFCQHGNMFITDLPGFPKALTKPGKPRKRSTTNADTNRYPAILPSFFLPKTKVSPRPIL